MIWIIYGWYAFAALAHMISIVEGARGHAQISHRRTPEVRVIYGFASLVLIALLMWLIRQVAA